MRLYQQERYLEAASAFEQVAAGRAGDAPANRQKAEFFLGKAQYRLGILEISLPCVEEASSGGFRVEIG